MSTKTISITEEAYDCLRSLKSSDAESFSQIIIKFFPKRRTLSEIFADLDPDNEFADAVESIVQERRNDTRKNIRF